VIVVEDGTHGVPDGSTHGLRLLRVGPVGRSAARNAGVKAAMTPFVAFLDDDDVALPGRLDRLRDALRQAEASPLSFGHVHVIDGEGSPLAEWNERLGRRFRGLAERGADVAGILASRCPIYTSATMVRREAFLEVDGYDPHLDAYEDLDLYLRLAELAPLVPCTGEPVSAYRLHGANTPSQRLYEGAVAVTAKHLPAARGNERRLLLEWRFDALWGLGRFRTVRREAIGAALRDPLLLTRLLLVKRLVGAALPTRLLEARR
jgi:glycosyltransferase involved in cell wall biosynthesis